MQWLWYSLVVSVVLTVVLNLALRAWPGSADRGARRLDDWARRQETGTADRSPQRVRVHFPWKAMIVASIALTVLLNVVLRLAT